ncbi:non-ribosomal peptide synthetase [Flavobacterium amniphilum]|uniref:non-ribosomal peptide synthetase n=1 Tax=Flavobacterium amniphilum TaxID=1834035 RepID=UPI00202A52F7|nr:non-ribosomal peptide synthetase [Flavobacterium amniphilum]MCL9807483.1 non-ribosomal peptide synthetase [Flavobacterium amniphilum]
MDNNVVLNSINLVSKYWKKKITNREGVFLRNRKQNNLPSITIGTNELNYFNSLTNKNTIARLTVITTVYSFLLKRLISEFDGYVVSDYEGHSNTLLLAFPTNLKSTFKEYLQKVKLEILETFNHSDFDKEVIAEKAGFDNLNLLSNYGININALSKSDCNGILFNVKITENDGLEIQISYLEGFVKDTVANFLIKSFKDFLINLESNIDVNLSEFNLLSEKEKSQLLVDFNETYVAYPDDKTIVDLFEDQVTKTPHNLAVVFKESHLTYEELNKKANQLANYIITKDIINKGDIVGVFLPKSDTGIISLLAILKLGAVYLPIDTNYPKERIDHLIKDSGLKLVISDTAGLVIDNCDCLNINEINFENYCCDNLNSVISSDDSAYLIYTSGSTGLPKGVVVSHTSNVNMSLDQIRTFEITESDKVVWFASVAFDASISEIMMSLYSGATLTIPTEETIKDKDQFVDFIKVTKSSVVTFPPSYLGLLSEEEISGLRCIITAGESANPAKANAVVASGTDYYNAYGPTECAVCVSIYKVSKDDIDKSIIPIGKPISNLQVYILDERLKPVPIGVSGKLYVSGVGLAKGYLNRTELTNEKFIPNPFAENQLMYETGDLACWLPDGNIEFLGRKDQQIKIRGYRIELGEIENAISQFSEDLKQVVVEVKENNQEKVLAAYFVSVADVNKSELRAFLQEKLPEYMVPGFYVALNELPLTPNGKIDRKALPEITSEDIIRKEYVAPRNETEEKLIGIWQGVLGIEKIGITDNFFELGGHSLKITKMLYQINESFGIELQMKNVLALQNVEALGELIETEIAFKNGIKTNKTNDETINKDIEVWEL